MVKISLGITTAEFDEVFADQKVSVTFSVATRTLDPIYGQTETVSYADSTKQWIFFKHDSDIVLKKWGIVDAGDAYVMMETSDSIAFGDRANFFNISITSVDNLLLSK